MTRRALLGALAASLCGCLSFQVGDRKPGGEVPVPADSPAPAAAPAAPATRRPAASAEDAAIETALKAVERDRAAYKIGPSDLLEISVYQEKDLDKKVRVSPDGVVTMPLAGAVKVAGLGIPEAEAAVVEKLRRFVINPQVSVFVVEYGNKQVYVLGEVAKPGSYALPTESGLTVIEAITLAGGFGQFAAQDRTKIIRKSKGGASQSIPIDVSAITKRGDKSKDLPLEPNDVVYVPESMF